jgi:thioredoxin-like negative regulator of GroEL
MQSQNPKMPRMKTTILTYLLDDLKIAECFIAMHSYAVYQSALSQLSSSQESSRLNRMSQLCEGLEASL